MAKFLLDGAFAVCRCALAVAGVQVDFAASLQEAVRAYASFWHGDDLALKSAPLALSAYACLEPKGTLLRIDEHLPVFEVVGPASAAQDTAHAVQVARAMVRYALRWLFKDAKGPADLDLLPEPGDADRRWTTIAFVAESGSQSHGVLGMLILNRQGWPNPAGVFFPDPVTLGITGLDDDWRRGFTAAQEAALRYAQSVEPSIGPRDVCWRVGPLPSHRDRSDDRSYRRPLVLEGASASGAAASGLAVLQCDWHLDAGICFTGEIDNASVTRSVSGKTDKFKAVGQEIGEQVPGSTVQTMLVGAVGLTAADRDWWTEFAGRHEFSIVFVNNLSDAVNRMSGLLEELLLYLHALTRKLDSFPWPGKRKTSFFGNLHVAQQICRHRRHGHERDWERERQRRAGTLIEGSDDSTTHYAHRDSPTGAYSESNTDTPIFWYLANSTDCARERHHSAILLADPGMGKTILLRFETYLSASQQLAQLSTGFLPLNDFQWPIFTKATSIAVLCAKMTALDRIGTEDMVEPLVAVACDPRHGGIPISEQLLAFFRTQILRGHIVLSIDGLDEVPNAHYAAFTWWLHALTTGAPLQRLYLSSRIVGYRGSPVIDSDFAELDLLAFTQKEIQAFAAAYFDEVQTVDAMMRHLSAHPGLLGLAQTPLLLTLICLTFDNSMQREQLPFTRCRLFAECLDGLLGRWPQFRAADSALAPSLLDVRKLQLLVDLLADVAWKLASHNPEATVFSLAQVYDALHGAGDMLNRLHWTEDGAVQAFTETHGILTREGSGNGLRLLFLHRTFQEYLVAWALGRREDWLKEATRHVFEPAWSEVLSLVGGVLYLQDERDNVVRQARPQVYVNELLRAAPKDLLLRPFLIAMRASSEYYAYPTRYIEAVSRLIVRLQIDTRNWLADDDEYLSESDLVWKPLIPSGGTEFYHFVPRLIHFDAIREASRMLTRWTQPLFRSYLDPARYPDAVRYEAVSNLRWAGRPSSDTVQFLVQRMADVNANIRSCAAKCLAIHDCADADVIRTVVQAQQIDIGHEWLGRDVAESLGKLCRHDSDTTQALCLQLRSPDPRLRELAGHALGETQLSHPEIVQALKGALWDAEPDVRLAVAKALINLRAVDTEVALMLCLHVHDRDAVRSQEKALELLGELGETGQTSPEVTEVFLQVMNSGTSWAQRRATEAMVKLRLTDDRILQALRAAFEDPHIRSSWAKSRKEEFHDRLEFAKAFGNLVDARPELLRELARDLLITMAPQVQRRQFAAIALSELDEHDDAILANLREATNDLDPKVRSFAGRALGKHVNTQEWVKSILCHLCQNRLQVQWEVVSALRQLRPIDEEAAAVFCQLARHSSQGIRCDAVEALGNVSKATPDVLDALRTAIRDEDWNVRLFAAESLADLVGPGNESIDTLLGLLCTDDGNQFGVGFDGLWWLGTSKQVPIPPERAPHEVRHEFDRLYRELEKLCDEVMK